MLWHDAGPLAKPWSAFVNGSSVEGELVWADGHFLKIRRADGEILVPKTQIERMEPLEGTEMADLLDLTPGG